MSDWALSVTDTFLNELLNIPQSVSKKVTKAVKVLEKDPISAQGDAKKLKGYQSNIYRIRVGNYRVFYSFGQGWVKLLSVRKRDERTYETEIPQFSIPSSPPPSNSQYPTGRPEVYAVPNSPFPTPNSQLPTPLSKEILQQWQIPQEYWEEIFKIDNPDAILELPIPDKFISRILDNLYPRPIEQIEIQTQYLLNEPEDLDKFFAGDITAFLLKLDAEQEKLRDFRTNGPILVKGGPGTGKSTLALYRVLKLLQKGYSSILFTTYTNALVSYSEQLLGQLLRKPPSSSGVKVTTVDSIIYHYYSQKYGKPKFPTEKQSFAYLQTAINSTQIPAKNIFESRVIHQTLENLGTGYLLQEIQTVIQGWGITNFQGYRDIERSGRGVALKANIRESIWAIYQTWLSLIKRDGYITWEELRCKALLIVQEIPQKPYQAIIIDEAQDLSPVSLRFLLALVNDFAGVYFTADASQSLYQRGFSWKQIHSELKVTGRTLLLKRNYRNTPQIINACTNILANTNAGDRDSLEQEPSPYQGDLPRLLLLDDIDSEVKAIRDFFVNATQKFHLPLHGGAVLCLSSHSGEIYAKKLTKLGLKAKFVTGKEIDLKAPHIKILTLHSAKGLEFPFVVVVGLQAGYLPSKNKDLPEDEMEFTINEQRRLFYVGCSRAMRALMVCGSAKSPSEFIDSLGNDFWERINYEPK